MQLYADDQDERLYFQAEGRFKSSEYIQAIGLYDELITDFPYSEYVADAQFRKAVALYRTGQIDEAHKLFEKIEIRYRSGRYIGYVPFWKGVIYYHKQDYAKSIEQFDAFLFADPLQYADEALQYLAMSQKAVQKNVEAMETLEKLLNKDELNIDRGYPVSLLASLYLRAGRSAECETMLEQLDMEALGPLWEPRLRLYLAEAKWNNGHREESEKIYKSLLSESTAILSVVLPRLFDIYRSGNRKVELDSILATAEEKLSGKPDILSEFWLRIGIDAYKRGEYNLAGTYLAKSWSSGNFEHMNGLVPLYYAEYLFKNDKANDAMNVIDSYLLQSSGYRELLIYRKIIHYWDTDNYTELEQLIPSFLKEFPGSPKYAEASYLYASALVKLNKMSLVSEVLIDIEQKNAAGKYEASFLRIKSVLQKRLGDYSSAITTLKTYTPMQPDDVYARVDLVKLYYETRNYTGVIIETDSLLSDVPAFQKEYYRQYILLSYLKGLAYIQNGSSRSAIDSFKPLSRESFEKTGYMLLYPYFLYYKGWAVYQEGNYSTAQALFAELLARDDNPFRDKVVYLAGWCAFLNSDFKSAESYFSISTDNADSFSSDRARYMYAKSLAAGGKDDAARAIFGGLAADAGSVFADDAMFEQANLLAKQGKVKDAVALYRKVYDQFPVSTLAEESMYRRGEVLYKNKDYAEARTVYRDYRIAFPKGKLADAALFQGGMSAFRLDESNAAALLWESLIEDYKKSTFRAEAAYRAADIFNKNGNFDKAKKLYQLLIIEYPDAAKAVDAETKLQKILYRETGNGNSR